MKVSVITVCRNAASTIVDTLHSVASQDYPNIEHLVIDGASTDQTVATVERSMPSITRLYSEPDRGIYDAMNKGVRLATGDVIGFLNADDVYASRQVVSNVAKRMVAELLDAVFGDVEFVSQSKVVRRFTSRRFSPARLASGWMPAHPTLYMRKAVYDKYGPMKTDYRIGADFEYIARVFKDGALKYAYMDDVLVRMCIGGVSTRGISSMLTNYREVTRALRENGIPSSHCGMVLRYISKLSELRIR